MKYIIPTISVLTLGLCSLSACARNDIEEYSIDEVLSTAQAKNILGTDIQFYFGDQPHGEIVKHYSEYGTNLKTNGTNKSDKAACQWVFLSTMKSLRDKAREVGANAVVNIRSNYKDNLTSSTTTFMCGSGALMSGVALKGEVVTLQE